MEWEKLGGPTKYINAKSLGVGGSFDGTFKGTRQLPNRKDPTKMDKFHDFEIDGELKTLNGTGQIDYILNDAKPGDFLRVEYKGKELAQSGRFKGTATHQWDVKRGKIDAENPPF